MGVPVPFMRRRDGRSLSRREHPITMRAEARDEDREHIGYRSNGSYASHGRYMLASHVGRSSGDYPVTISADLC